MFQDNILSLLGNRDYKPLKIQELAAVLEIPEDNLEVFCNELRELEQSGVIAVSKKQRYGLCEKMNLLTGVMDIKKGGYGFLIPDNHSFEDVFVPGDKLGTAICGDRVQVRLSEKRRHHGERLKGEVVKILARKYKEIIGIYRESGSCVEPLDHHLSAMRHLCISRGYTMGASEGDTVLVTMLYPKPGSKGRIHGRIKKILAREGAGFDDLAVVLNRYNLTTDFPEDVLAYGNKVSQEEDKDSQRIDLTEEQIVTIDGADARDLDDAVSLAVDDAGNFVLGVHIADVSSYVTEGSPIDREAYRRGTSVYLPECVLPMLPVALSNGVCSLNPGVPRRTITCRMVINHKGKVLDSKIFSSLISSSARMTYSDVNGILDGNPELTEKYKTLVPLFYQLEELRRVLLKKRRNRGSLFFDFPEARAVLNENGETIDIALRQSGRAEGIIEECMIVANETVAETFEALDYPMMYRIHEIPEDDEIIELHDRLWSLGYSLSHHRCEIKPYHIQKLLKKTHGTSDQYLLETIVLRTLKHARYSTENKGHFGLSSRCYCHFTSPIRRYPDLWVHRLIRRSLLETDVKNSPNLLKHLEDAATQSSDRERNAEEAEREALDFKKSQYIAQHIGEVFPGIISGVLSFGFFVELENTVEGLVPVTSLEKDEYLYHSNSMTLSGRHNGICFHLGDPVLVKIDRVLIEEHKNDFTFEGFREEDDAEDEASEIRN